MFVTQQKPEHGTEIKLSVKKEDKWDEWYQRQCEVIRSNRFPPLDGPELGWLKQRFFYLQNKHQGGKSTPEKLSFIVNNEVVPSSSSSVNGNDNCVLQDGNRQMNCFMNLVCFLNYFHFFCVYFDFFWNLFRFFHYFFLCFFGTSIEQVSLVECQSK